MTAQRYLVGGVVLVLKHLGLLASTMLKLVKLLAMSMGHNSFGLKQQESRGLGKCALGFKRNLFMLTAMSNTVSLFVLVFVFIGDVLILAT